MKNKRFFIGVVVVFVVLFAFFLFFYGFRVVRTQFGVVGGVSTVDPTVLSKAVEVAKAEHLVVPRQVGNVTDEVHKLVAVQDPGVYSVEALRGVELNDVDDCVAVAVVNGDLVA